MASRPCARFLPIVAVIVLSGNRAALAGPLPMPLEANLDLAEYVVVGTIAGMEEIKDEKKSIIRWSTATVAIGETLKGKESKNISFQVASWMAPDSDFAMASPPRIYKMGDAGIWLVRPDGRVSHTHGLLPEGRKDEIKGILKSLAERKWSEAANGLQACTSVIRYEYYHRSVLLVAARNASGEPLFCPSHATLIIVAKGEEGKEFILGKPVESGEGNEKVRCERLESGQVIYRPDNWTFIDIASEVGLPRGKYQVTASFENGRDGWVYDGSTKRMPVNAWKGKLTAPPVELVIEEDAKKR